MEKRYNACGGSFLKFKINMQSKFENHKHVHIIFRMKNANIKLGYISPCMPYSTTKSQQDIFQNNICSYISMSQFCHLRFFIDANKYSRVKLSVKTLPSLCNLI